MGLLDAFAKRVCTGKLVSRRSYTFFVGPVWILLGLSFFLGIYGFGTWVVPLAEQEFCEGYQNEARCGVMYPFASIFLVMSVSTATGPAAQSAGFQIRTVGQSSALALAM